MLTVKRCLVDLIFAVVYVALIPITLFAALFASFFGLGLGIVAYAFAINFHGDLRDRYQSPENKRVIEPPRYIPNATPSRIYPMNSFYGFCGSCGALRRSDYRCSECGA